MTQNPYFNADIQGQAQAHLQANPENVVTLIVAGQFAVRVLAFEGDNGRGLRVRTETGTTCLVDRSAVLMVGLDMRDPKNLEPTIAETMAPGDEFAGVWAAGVEKLRTAASVSKDKAVLAAFNELREIENSVDGAKAAAAAQDAPETGQ